MLDHTLPQTGTNVMFPSIDAGENLTFYDDDYNDILGIRHMLALADTLGVAGGCPAVTQVYPSTGGCPTVNPTACVRTINGINDVSGSSETFSAILYPNPYEDNMVLHIDVSQYTDFSISIYDLIGHLVLQKNMASAVPFDLPLSGFDHSAGMYIIQVSDSHNSKVLKLVKL